uniref:N4-(Beta-N-acetylglucosaminyl)-L-asparaginase n=1 Tax=Candidatus Kentrum sp. DK TaxID=2126562 RepID=A0A450SQC9_9GAMM|nr:MAG: N4-(beta-N-acetylglucosaminyl)-L-asparaginase [Candidatus Kentron sp. DK]
MMNRRHFLATSALGVLTGTQGFDRLHAETIHGPSDPHGADGPLVVSTWSVPRENEAAGKVLSDEGGSLDAVETGVRFSESDPGCCGVGLGGLPDREGRVTLDACIMEGSGRCGSVAFLQHIENPVSVARRVMENTPHVMLVGEGALQFALRNGFEKRDLLTETSRRAWRDWLSKQKKSTASRRGGVEDHDTIGMVAMDKAGNLAGACSTSGLAWKMPGRVGDSPIIGAGLYVDNEAGAAAATGLGEAVIRVAGSFLVVELMRQGHPPTEACRLAIERVTRKTPDWRDIQVGFVALDKHGRYGAYSIAPGFTSTVYDGIGGNRVIRSESLLS